MFVKVSTREGFYGLQVCCSCSGRRKLRIFLGKLLWTDDHVDVSRGRVFLNTVERFFISLSSNTYLYRVIIQ